MRNGCCSISNFFINFIIFKKLLPISFSKTGKFGTKTVIFVPNLPDFYQYCHKRSSLYVMCYKYGILIIWNEGGGLTKKCFDAETV